MKKVIGHWRLFWVLALALNAATIAALPFSHFDSIDGLRSLIRHSVRCALPFFWLAFTASSLARLWPNPGTRWLLSNRRYFGLTFALGMAWQLVFIVCLARTCSAYFYSVILTPDTIVLGGIGYLFLSGMTLTSFRRCARRLTARTWRRVHKAGMYVLWLFITASYVAPRPGRSEVLRYVVLGLFLAAWLLRMGAWSRKRRLRPSGVADSAVLRHSRIAGS